MAAYAAMVSLKKKIERIIRASRICLVPPSLEILCLVYWQLKLFQQILKRLDRSSIKKSRKKVNALDGRIKEAVWEFEDMLESHLSDQIISGGEREKDPMLFSIDLQSLKDDADSFIVSMEGMKKKYIHELNNMPEEEDEPISSRIDIGGINSKMVGPFDEFRDARDSVRVFKRYSSISIFGMAGTGKTTLAKKIFDDHIIVAEYKRRAWIRVGRNYQFDEIVGAIRAQLTKNGSLRGNAASLIVLDDVWDTQLLDYFQSFGGGRITILLTTRLRRVSRKTSHQLPVMRLLSAEESKDLLFEKVFGEEDCPPQLEKAGEKIAEKCEGLPLMIVTVAGLLSKAQNRDPQYWNDVAKMRNSVFKDAYEEISKVLFPTYDCLPQHLKMLFLYLGVFPQDHKISISRLINMMKVEGFLEPNINQTLDEFVGYCLIELDLWNNILISNKKSVHWFTETNYSIKTCRLHSCWRHFCSGEARKNNFCHVVKDPLDVLEDGIKGSRRLCVHCNILFGIKQVYNTIKCDCASTARSLLCFGPYHQYPVPIDVGFKFLTLLDALKLRFYNFPVEILKLVQLRFLALTYNGKLPPSISKLFNLEFLIIHPHISIKSYGAPSYMPIQIWDMKELKHIEIVGSTLPNPTCGASLENLLTLVGVSPNSCTRGALKKIPNIRKLGIQIELTPNGGDSYTWSFFDHMSELKNLDTLKCSIVNPEAKYGFVAPLTPLSVFPSRLRKLHMSGFNYPWKYMAVISWLPNLEVLKLRSYAFRGPNWEIKNKSFPRLRFLLIEDTDLVQWNPSSGSFQCLTFLSLKHCYKLEDLHWPSGSYSVGRIELVDCNPLAVKCAEQLKLRCIYDRLDVTETWYKK